MTTKERIEKAIRYNNMEGCEREAIAFISELLDLYAYHMHETEPYATNSIREMSEAASRVRSLEEFLDEVMEG